MTHADILQEGIGRANKEGDRHRATELRLRLQRQGARHRRRTSTAAVRALRTTMRCTAKPSKPYKQEETMSKNTNEEELERHRRRYGGPTTKPWDPKTQSPLNLAHPAPGTPPEVIEGEMGSADLSETERQQYEANEAMLASIMEAHRKAQERLSRP